MYCSDAGLNGRTAAACWGRGLEVEAAAKLTKRSEMEHVSHNSQDFTALQVATPFAVDSDFSFPLLMIVRNEGQQPSRNWKNVRYARTYYCCYYFLYIYIHIYLW